VAGFFCSVDFGVNERRILANHVAGLVCEAQVSVAAFFRLPEDNVARVLSVHFTIWQRADACL